MSATWPYFHWCFLLCWNYIDMKKSRMIDSSGKAEGWSSVSSLQTGACCMSQSLVWWQSFSSCQSAGFASAAVKGDKDSITACKQMAYSNVWYELCQSYKSSIKGIVPFGTGIFPLFTHPHVSNPCNFFCGTNLCFNCCFPSKNCEYHIFKLQDQHKSIIKVVNFATFKQTLSKLSSSDDLVYRLLCMDCFYIFGAYVCHSLSLYLVGIFCSMRNNDIMVILCTYGMNIFTLYFVLRCFRGRRTKVRKKTKYTILDNMDEQERMELQPKYSKFQTWFLD